MTTPEPTPARAWPGRLAEVLGRLALAPEPGDRAELLLAFADRFREVPPGIAHRPFPRLNQVPACESEAYVWGVLGPDGTLTLHFAVENPSGVSARALASILDQSLSGLPPAEIATVSPDVVYEIFRRDISMGKGLGLMSMVRAVQTVARQAAAASPEDLAASRIFPRAPAAP
jgi:cysteine desulfuration protein SufE